MEKENLYLDYIALKLLFYTKATFPFLSGLIESVETKFDLKEQIIKLELIDSKNIRDIVFENKSVRDVFDIIPTIKIDDINEYIMHKNNIIVMDICLDNDRSVKSLFEHYADRSKIYDHTVGNILALKNLESETMKVNYLVSFKKKTKEYQINEIKNTHIADIYTQS